jgi:hypothetical protein
MRRLSNRLLKGFQTCLLFVDGGEREDDDHAFATISRSVGPNYVAATSHAESAPLCKPLTHFPLLACGPRVGS